MTHTPTPWHVNHDRPEDATSQLSISNGDARIIANVVTRETTHGFAGGSANAAFIVRAVNSHDALVKALEDVAAAYVNAPGWASPTPTSELVWEMYQAARKALLAISDPAPPVEQAKTEVEG